VTILHAENDVLLVRPRIMIIFFVIIF